MKLNASLIKRFMGCPLQARFAEIEQRPSPQNAKASFGTCIHDALHLFNVEDDVEAAKARFNMTWDQPELLGVAPDYWPKYTDFATLRKRGFEILDVYAAKQTWEKREVIAAEHKFCVPFGDHLLSGIIDLLEVKTDSKGKQILRVIDYKTNAKQPTKDVLSMDIQFTSYVYATLQPEFWLGFENDPAYPPLENGQELFDLLTGVERKGIWYHLWGNKELVVGPRDDGDFMRLYRCVNEIVNAIEKDVYIPDISGNTCVYCPFQDICHAVIPIREKLEIIDDDEYGMIF